MKLKIRTKVARVWKKRYFFKNDSRDLNIHNSFHISRFINTMSLINCLVGLVALSATATLEVLGSIPRTSKKCY